MSYLPQNPAATHPALLAHYAAAQHRLVSDPVNVAPGGAVPALSYHGGPTIATPKVVNLYAGQFWDDATFVDAFTARVVENGYLSAAAGQGTGPGSFAGSFLLPAPAAASTDADVRALLAGSVGQNGIPAPDPNTLYVLLLPAGCTVSFTAGGDASCAQFCGYHASDQLAGAPLYYTVQPATQCAGCFQATPRIGLQMVIAHEIAEACTDPDGRGWFNDQTGEENADECAWVQDQYGQDVVQGYAALNSAGQWVNSLGAYVAPQPGPPPPAHFKPSGPAATAWAVLAAGGQLAIAELTLLLDADPTGPAAPAWRYLLAGGAVQALLDSGWGAWFHGRGAA